jgi:hypothetical protein
VTKIHVTIDLVKAIGVKPDNEVTRKFVRTLLDNHDQRWGSLTIQDGEGDIRPWRISVTGACTAAQELSIEKAVHRKIEYCLAAWEG